MLRSPSSPEPGAGARERRLNTPYRIVVARLLVLLTTFALLFLGLESYYRFFCDTTDSFGLSQMTMRWLLRHYQLNQNGVRDNVDYFLEIPPGKSRITFLGDSFTAGHGIRDVEDRFANIIRRRKSGEWDVHVLAVNGFDTGSELNYLVEATHSGCELDTVVLIYCLNDIADLVPEWGAILERISADQRREPRWLRASYFVNTWYYRLKGMRDPNVSNYYQFVQAAYDSPLWDQQQARLQELQRRVIQAGGRLAVVTFPFMHQIGPDYQYRKVHAELDRFWKQQAVPHLDLLPIFEAQPDRRLTVNRFDAHPNERAHRIAADAIQSFLERKLAGAPPRSARKRE